MDASGFSAFVIADENTDYNLLGLTLLERTLIALAKTGAENIALVGQDVEHLKSRTKRASQETRLHYFSKNEISNAWQEAIQSANTGVFYVPELLAVDTSVLQDLKKQIEIAPITLTENAEVALISQETAKQIAFADLEDSLGIGERISIGHRTCHAIHSNVELKTVKQRMIRNLVKPSDGVISRNVNRKISTAISRWLAYLPITPNQITIFTGIIAFIPCYFMYQGGYINWLIGAAIYQLASTLDGVDGEIARLKMQSSKFGQWLDTLLDFVSMIAVLFCLVLGVHRAGEPEYILWAGKLAGIFTLLCFTGLLLYLIRFKKEGSFNIQYSFLDSGSVWAKAIKAVDFLGKRDFYIFLFFVLALFGLMPWALIYVGGFTMFIFLFIVQAHLRA